MAYMPAPFEAFQFHTQLPNGGLFEGHVGKLPMPGRPVKAFGPKAPVKPRPGSLLVPKRGRSV